MYEKAITIPVSKEIDASNDDHGELKEVAQAAFSLAKMSDKERQRLALRLMNIMEIIDRLERYLEVLDNPRDNMAALWLRDPDEEPDGNVLPLYSEIFTRTSMRVGRTPTMENRINCTSGLLGCAHYATYALRLALVGAAVSAEEWVNGSGAEGRWSDNAGAEGSRPHLFENKEHSSRRPVAAHSPGGISCVTALLPLLISTVRGRPDIIAPVWIAVYDP